MSPEFILIVLALAVFGSASAEKVRLCGGGWNPTCTALCGGLESDWEPAVSAGNSGRLESDLIWEQCAVFR